MANSSIFLLLLLHPARVSLGRLSPQSSPSPIVPPPPAFDSPFSCDHISVLQPMAVVALLQRSPDSIDHYGRNVFIHLHGVEGQSMEAILSTDHDFLFIYTIALTTDPPGARYKFDTSRSLTSQRRRSFAGAFESELIMPYSLKQKRIIKIDSRLSWYGLSLHRKTNNYVQLFDTGRSACHCHRASSCHPVCDVARPLETIPH